MATNYVAAVDAEAARAASRVRPGDQWHLDNDSSALTAVAMLLRARRQRQRDVGDAAAKEPQNTNTEVARFCEYPMVPDDTDVFG